MLTIVQREFEEPSNRSELTDEAVVIHKRAGQGTNRVLALFVHGLGGARYGEKSTWGYFPRFVFEDFPQTDVALYEYRTLLGRLRFWQSVTLSQEAEVLAGALRDATEYDRILLVGHSMGGLLCMEAIRFFLKSNQQLQLNRIAGLFLMATPQAGSQRVPGFLAWFSKDFRALKPHGDFVKEIHAAFANYILVDVEASAPGRTKIPAFALLGSHDHWVDGMSAGLGIPDSQKRTVRGSHTQIVKPSSKEHDAYRFLHTCLQNRVLLPAQPTERVIFQKYLDRLTLDFEQRSYINLPETLTLTARPGRIKALPPFQQSLVSDTIVPATPVRGSIPAPDMSQPAVALDRFLATHARIALLGPPGSGKSTMLRHLVSQFSHRWRGGNEAADEGRYQQSGPAQIPIFGALSHWRDGSQDLVGFLQDQIRGCGVPELAERLPGLMEQGRVVVLLDGLNELPQLDRDPRTGVINDARVKKIARLGASRQDATVSCVVTCRDRDFYGGPRWPDLHVMGLADGQIEEFARIFYQHLPDGVALAKTFLARLHESQNARRDKLFALARQPFSLMGLLFYFQEQAEHKLPLVLTDLLENTVRLALRRASRAGLFDESKVPELRAALDQLAFNMMDAEYVGAVPQAEAIPWLFHTREPDFQDRLGGYVPSPTSGEVTRGRELIQAARAAGLLYVSETEVQFLHQMLQEFFCASHCAQQQLGRELLNRTTYPQFDEVWPMWAQLEPRVVGRLIDALESVDDTLGWTDDSLKLDVARALGQTLDVKAVAPLARVATNAHKNMDLRLCAARALGNFKCMEAISPLLALLREGYSETTLVAAQSLGLIGALAFAPLVSTLDDLHDVGLRDAVRALGWIGDSRAVPHLKRLSGRPDVIEEIDRRDGTVSENVARAVIAQLEHVSD